MITEPPSAFSPERGEHPLEDRDRSGNGICTEVILWPRLYLELATWMKKRSKDSARSGQVLINPRFPKTSYAGCLKCTLSCFGGTACLAMPWVLISVAGPGDGRSL